MIIDKKTFLAKVEQIAAEEPAYRSGGSGTDGTCDCIGLIIGAIRRAGGSWRGMHGSNYAAKNEVEYLNPITSASVLMVGEVVFKAYNPGDDKYGLPARYAADPDQRDYYHVGVVISVNPLRIRHMTSPKPKVDTSLGKWGFHGWLKKISNSDEGGGQQMEEKVTIQGGNATSPVNMRSGPSKNNKIINTIAQGTIAILLDKPNDEWYKIQVGNRTGYVQSCFVHAGESVAPAIGTITIPIADLELVYDKIGNMLGRRG